MPEILSTSLLSLIVGLSTGAAAGYLGSLMILKRMALVGDALTHVALPGIGISLLFNLNPFLGAFAFLLMATLLIWKLERRTALAVETIVGILFAASLAMGILITPEPELLEALFGDISKTKAPDALAAVILSLVALTVTKKISRPILIGVISEEFAQASGIKVSRNNFIFLLLVSLIVALGIKVVGTLLMGALVIIPAAASKNMAASFSSYGILSAVLGFFTAGIGIWFAAALNLPPGPLVVLSSATVFLFSLVFRK